MSNSDSGDAEMKSNFKITLILALVLGMLGLMLLNTVWPRQTSLSTESMQGITQIAESMKQSADNWEKIAKSTAEMHQILQAQAQGSRNEINQLHEQLMGRYGLDANDPLNDYVNSMLEQSNGYGGGDVPRGEGRAGADRIVQETNVKSEVKIHRSAAGAADHSNGTPAQAPQ